MRPEIFPQPGIQRGPDTPEQRLGQAQRRLQELEAKLERYKVAQEDSTGHIDVELKTNRKFTKEEAIADVERAITMAKEEIANVETQVRIGLSRL